METRTLTIKAGWLLSLRLATYIMISGIVIFWLGYPQYLSFPFFAYSLLTLCLPLLYILKRWYNFSFLLKAIPIIQILLEIVVEVGIIYSTGNLNSAYSALFIMTIISTALVTNLAGTLGLASLVSLSYAFIVWFGLSYGVETGLTNQALETIFSSEDAAFYNIFLHILTFFLTAFISGFLVERLKLQDRELADTSKALKKARLETDDILRHLSSGLFTIDREGKIVFFNRVAGEILGFKENEVKGRDFREIFQERTSQLVWNLVNVLETNREYLRSEIEVINGRGLNIPIGVSTSILREDDGIIRGVIVIFQDLSETKKMEQKIRAADKMAAVGELSAAIAHEIRNPLAAISGSVEVLNAEMESSNENRKLFKLILKESGRLNNILTDFLLYARNQRAAFVRVEVCRLTSDVIAMVKHHPSYNPEIEISFYSDDSVVYVYNDENQLNQILINLVVNACEAFESRAGQIDIKISQPDSEIVRIEVVDNGPGISDEHKAKIFNPFYSTKKYGTGLGLAIVQRLSNSLGILLSCVPNKPLGTKFILDLSQVPNEFEIESPDYLESESFKTTV